MNRRLLILFFLVLCGTISKLSFASCTQYTSRVTANAGTINVSNDTPNGTLLATIENEQFVSMFNCTGRSRVDEFFIGGWGSMVANYNGQQVFSTNIPGIGVALGADVDCYDYLGGTQCRDVAPFPPVYIPAGRSQLSLQAYGTTSSSVDWKAGYGIKIYKTGTVSGGNFSGDIAHWFMSDVSAGSVWLNMTGVVNVDVPPTPSTCTVLTPDVSTALGNYLTTDFTGVNSATASIHVPVKLDCPASNMHIQVRVNATADTSTTQPGAIRLDAGSPLTATGVAIQMVDKNDNGLPINQDWSETTGEAGKVNLGLHARYLQTGPVVTAGDANASATLTLNYE